MPPPHPGAVAFRVLQEDFVSNDNDGHHEQPVEQPSPDLTYLHPDNLHIGHIGVFAGDWAWTGNPPRIPVGFIGVLIDYFPDHEDHLCKEVPNAGRTSSSADERESRSARSLPRAFETQGVAGRVALPGKRYLIWSAQPARTRISVATSAAARSLVTVKSSMGVVVGIRLCS
jgi:hypothetical protein